jgi:hypothetical protein
VSAYISSLQRDVISYLYRRYESCAKTVCVDHAEDTEGSVAERLLSHLSRPVVPRPSVYFPIFPLIHLAVLSTPVVKVISTRFSSNDKRFGLVGIGLIQRAMDGSTLVGRQWNTSVTILASSITTGTPLNRFSINN